MTTALPYTHGLARLTHLGVIHAQGEDAAAFLHGQLTQDFVLLDQTQARLAAFCSAKGRMQASFIGIKRSPSELLLICPQDVLASTLKRLALFVLRAKVKLRDASADFVLDGLAGDALAPFAALAAPNPAPWARQDLDNGAHLVFLYPAAGVLRALRLAPADSDCAADTATLALEHWHWLAVCSGVASISAATSDAFVPQMLNYESIGGVNFKKGCYPGQEVVARSQFRGVLKRRAYLAHCAAAMQAGDDIFQHADADQPCGKVAQAAAAPQGGFDAIVSVQISAFEAGNLHLKHVDGPRLLAKPVPYALLADI